jgi:taurine dioxygenase
MSDSNIEIVKINDFIGAEIRNCDLTRQTPEMHEVLRRALAEHAVIVIKDQEITPAHHAELAIGFGTPQNRVDPSTCIHGYPFMNGVSKSEDEFVNIGNAWHIDQTYQVDPPTTTLLVAREIPERGGDTLFSSMAAAYDALSDGLKATLDTLDAVHSNERVFARNTRLQGRTILPPVTHPVVIRNPITGRKSLYITAGYTLRFDGWTEQESEPLLKYLFQHGQRPEFQARIKWTPGTIAIFDNSQTWHYALNDYQGRRRYMERVTVKSFSIADSRAGPARAPAAPAEAA